MKKKSFLVAEVAQAHEGSINLAISYINIAKRCGYDAIKFQIHLTQYETTLDDKFRPGTINYNINRYNYWEKMEFTEDEWIKISNYCKKVDINLIISIFCFEAIEILKKLPHLYAIKISSGEMYNHELIQSVGSLKKPIIISTGMASTREILNLNKMLHKNKIKNFNILHCVSTYPTPIKNANLNKIIYFREKYQINLGYSDHTGNIDVIKAAISINTDIIEHHICFDKNVICPDTSSSLLPSEMKEISRFNTNFFLLFKNKFVEDSMKKTQLNKKLFTKSLSLKNDLKKGEVLKKENLTLKKPGTGLNQNFQSRIIGKTAKKNLSCMKLIKLSDFIK